MDGDDIKLPSNFTTSEGIGEDNIDTWMVSQSESTNDLTQDLGENNFKY